MDDMYLNIFTNAMGNIISQIVMIIAMIAVEKMKQTKKITVCPSRPVISDNVLFQMSIPFGLIELAFEALSVPALGVS